MAGIREFLSSTWGKAVAWTLVAVAGIAIFLAVRGNFGQSPAAAAASQRVFICCETGKSFNMELQPGMTIPVRSPHSGKDTGYPAELCYWTADGQQKAEPTAVLLKTALGQSGPTFCPDCGRLVVGHNPRPQPGATAPARQSEYHRQPSAEPRY